jgi:hypothetical protein
MQPTTETLPLPAVPLDVLEFADEQDVTWNLRPVATITQTSFPSRPITLRLEEDPEAADDRHIVIEVDVTGWTVDEMLAARNQWTQMLFRVCAPEKLFVFRIRMVQTA